MRSELSQSLAFLGHLAEEARIEPIVFGSTVLELLGIGRFQASDLDVIVSVDAAEALAAVAGVEPDGKGGNDRLRSRVRLRLEGAPLVIDVMAEMNIGSPDGWTLYEVAESVEIVSDGRRVRAASLADLRRFYSLAGRPKDFAKIAAIDAVPT
ncbi:hypothetical protein [Pleomorphomonas sp. NRK KF1]|uniref:hypothetical protein n=1 Tax=Pleomorphomonas sp. NRK KF1 TaxID=2943000 RepID=UPI002042F83C|nr:hypothetical protein [Pleomorphomonas sp. NRK KF1]MCM5552515.1 hypothetical protein [Pleomorphomonas sp. NRK KF1]